MHYDGRPSTTKLAAALLDRLADRATVIATKGKSYRQRRKAAADKKSTSKGSVTVADPV
jgi:DNA replication protein DnaC